MTTSQPSDLDRNIAHGIVGIIAGTVVGQKAGWAGFVIASIVGIMLHEALDAPLASAIAELT